MNNKIVSVIIPTYNQTDLLYKAVDSVLAQDLADIEIIIIDDNKNDQIKKLNKEYFLKLDNSKIIYIQNSHNIGATKSKNYGIKNSSGKYITFLDDDDIYLKDKIKKQYMAMENLNTDFSFCNMILTNEKGKVIDKRGRKFLKYDESILVKHFKYHITGNDTFMFKKDFLNNIKGYDEKDLGDDFYIITKAIENSSNYNHLDYYGVKALVHNTSGLSSYKNKIICEDNLYEFKKKYFKIFRQKDINYIKMRHHAVKAFAYKKGKVYLKLFKELLICFFICPIGLIKIFLGKDK